MKVTRSGFMRRGAGWARIGSGETGQAHLAFAIAKGFESDGEQTTKKLPR